MKKLALFGILMFSLVLVSCPSGNYLLAGLDVKISKFEVCVGEQIELDGIISNYAEFDKTGYIFYIEDYPKNYEVLEGKIYEPLTTGKYLCVEPVLNKNKEIMKIRMSFSETGEYTIKVNGFFSNMQEIGSAWNEDFYTYKILVK